MSQTGTTNQATALLEIMLKQMELDIYKTMEDIQRVFGMPNAYAVDLVRDYLKEKF